MNYLITKPSICIVLISIILSSCSVTSHSEKAEGVDFSTYKTFSWAEPANTNKDNRSDNDILDNNIKNAVSHELEKKGWVETGNSPDVLLDYTIAVRRGKRSESHPVYSRPYTSYFYTRRGIYSIWRPSTLVGMHLHSVPFNEGELTINMTDTKTNKLIWEGWATGEINNSRMTTKEVKEDIKSIFKKFDYPVNQ